MTDDDSRRTEWSFSLCRHLLSADLVQERNFGVADFNRCLENLHGWMPEHFACLQRYDSQLTFDLPVSTTLAGSLLCLGGSVELDNHLRPFNTAFCCNCRHSCLIPRCSRLAFRSAAYGNYEVYKPISGLANSTCVGWRELSRFCADLTASGLLRCRVARWFRQNLLEFERSSPTSVPTLAVKRAGLHFLTASHPLNKHRVGIAEHVQHARRVEVLGDKKGIV